MSPKKQPNGLSESQITAQVKSFMEAHGWRALRNTRMIAPGRFQTGEPGMPDFLFVHYLTDLRRWTIKRFGNPAEFEADERGDRVRSTLTLWVEFKRPEDRRKCVCLKNHGTRKRCTVCDQKNWKDREKQRGAMVWTVKDFIAFETLYRERFGWLHSGERAVGQQELTL